MWPSFVSRLEFFHVFFSQRCSRSCWLIALFAAPYVYHVFYCRSTGDLVSELEDDRPGFTCLSKTLKFDDNTIILTSAFLRSYCRFTHRIHWGLVRRHSFELHTLSRLEDKLRIQQHVPMVAMPLCLIAWCSFVHLITIPLSVDRRLTHWIRWGLVRPPQRTRG